MEANLPLHATPEVQNLRYYIFDLYFASLRVKEVRELVNQARALSNVVSVEHLISEDSYDIISIRAFVAYEFAFETGYEVLKEQLGTLFPKNKKIIGKVVV